MRFGTIGTPKRHNRAATKLEAARVKAARSNVHWTELDEADLVPRDGDTVFVSVSTDQVYAPARGVIFEPHSASPIATHSAFFFYVRDGEPVFLEQRPGTWSDEIRRREHRAARKATS